MKKFSLVLATAGLTASLGAYAALPTTAQPFQLEIPNLKPGLEVTLEGLLLRPTNSDMDYAQIQSFDFTAPPITFTTNNSVQSVQPGMDFGFRVGLGYVFADSGNDVQLNWTHFDHSNDDSTAAGPGQVLVTQIGFPLFNLTGLPFITSSSVTGTSTVDNQYNAIDLDVGQYVNVGTRLQMRFFGGLRAAQVKQNTTDSYDTATGIDLPFIVPFNVYTNETDTFNSKFTGIGPRFGVDTSYEVWHCFGVVAHLAGALLVGQVDTSTTNTVSLVTDNTNINNFLGLPATTTLNTSTDNVDRVVPAFDAKLGIDYTWEFRNRSSLSLEAGYQVTQYIDAVDNLNYTLLNGVQRQTSSVGYDGPYLSLNFHV